MHLSTSLKQPLIGANPGCPRCKQIYTNVKTFNGLEAYLVQDQISFCAGSLSSFSESQSQRFSNNWSKYQSSTSESPSQCCSSAHIGREPISTQQIGKMVHLLAPAQSTQLENALSSDFSTVATCGNNRQRASDDCHLLLWLL
mmetsp:Transcript_5289/g.8146  ORF Transcript_5289/g.8146 Transcript_5289/m.8146 type:complete len:143 (-) Transcript_5289:180-608(-)